MKVFFHEVSITTSRRIQLIDITHHVEEAVRRSGIANGVCIVFAPHATAAVLVNEHEEGLIHDIASKIEEIVEPERSWRHNIIDDNAHAHIGSAIIGSERVFPIHEGRIVRGTWQNIFLVELDGPRRERNVVIEVLGE
ncbi:MAG: secondary thiamine-phosphate synthase enzyme YjbQ [Sulfolobales archaeon]|nr:secondary thiamine-phosphate synthase enzyme YjbQ [Sulfolobales archaeon]MCX8198969.1 secondary thiamine-phosphate synthase enzyme YjbQ [Sulfolobales archaeon]MDW8169948.1 secondary thiamine-phosphate synthase enzyme YjbQ [Desulfurococcaceae archaeon]